jgi:growth factor-regulated tyrosine kinase substrate
LQKYCDNYIKLPHYGINTAVRVCVDCYDKLQAKQGIPPSKIDKPAAVNRYTSNNKDLDRALGDESFDADLKRALELSLADTPAPRPAGVTSYSSYEEDDEDMKAAIAASLQDFQTSATHGDRVQAPPSSTAGLYDFEPGASDATTAYPDSATTVSPSASRVASGSEVEELSPMECELVNRYVLMVENLQKSPPGTLLRDSKIQQLNENVMALRPKLVRTLTYTIDKSDRLESLHGKLAAVVRYYDKLLEDRLANASHYRLNPGYNSYDYCEQVPSDPSSAPDYGPVGYGNVAPPQVNYSQQAYQAPPPPVGYPYAPSAPSAPPLNPDYTGASVVYQHEAVTPSTTGVQAPPPVRSELPKEEAVLIEL